MALPQQVTGVILHGNVPIPEMPEGWSVDEADLLFENILACYVWRYLHVQTRSSIVLGIWKDTFSVVVEHCWYTIVALFEAFDKWLPGEDISLPDRNSINSENMYHIATAKRRYRRKSQDVRRYEDIDEYVDNMYLNE